MPRLILAPRAIADLTAISATLAEAAGKSVAIDIRPAGIESLQATADQGLVPRFALLLSDHTL